MFPKYEVGTESDRLLILVIKSSKDTMSLESAMRMLCRVTSPRVGTDDLKKVLRCLLILRIGCDSQRRHTDNVMSRLE